MGHLEGIVCGRSFCLDAHIDGSCAELYWDCDKDAILAGEENDHGN